MVSILQETNVMHFRVCSEELLNFFYPLIDLLYAFLYIPYNIVKYFLFYVNLSYCDPFELPAFLLLIISCPIKLMFMVIVWRISAAQILSYSESETLYPAGGLTYSVVYWSSISCLNKAIFNIEFCYIAPFPNTCCHTWSITKYQLSYINIGEPLYIHHTKVGSSRLRHVHKVKRFIRSICSHLFNGSGPPPTSVFSAYLWHLVFFDGDFCANSMFQQGLLIQVIAAVWKERKHLFPCDHITAVTPLRW